MNFADIITAVIIIGSIGLLIGLFLGIASIVFKTETDEREEKILESLPGNNCGGCGYAGCSALASAILKGEAPVNTCPVGGASVAAKIAETMGVEAENVKEKTAFVKCGGNCEKTKEKYNYTGIKDCKMAAFVPGKGSKSCTFGCIGFGNCVKVCEFNAISIVDGVAKVDSKKCKACGRCVKACPNNIIELIPKDASFAVKCSSHDSGKRAMKVCDASCIGCGACNKACPEKAIVIKDKLAHINQDLCTGCGTCVTKCKRNAIIGFCQEN